MNKPVRHYTTTRRAGSRTTPFVKAPLPLSESFGGLLRTDNVLGTIINMYRVFHVLALVVCLPSLRDTHRVLVSRKRIAERSIPDSRLW